MVESVGVNVIASVDVGVSVWHVLTMLVISYMNALMCFYYNICMNIDILYKLKISYIKKG